MIEQLFTNFWFACLYEDYSENNQKNPLFLTSAFLTFPKIQNLRLFGLSDMNFKSNSKYSHMVRITCLFSTLIYHICFVSIDYYPRFLRHAIWADNKILSINCSNNSLFLFWSPWSFGMMLFPAHKFPSKLNNSLASELVASTISCSKYSQKAYFSHCNHIAEDTASYFHFSHNYT